MEERSLDVRGTRVQLQVEGDGQPLLFLHGAGGPAWLPGPARLAQRFRVYAPAHPGFGQSDAREDWDSIDDFVYHYLDLLDALELDRVHLLGASLGGWLAAELAVGHFQRLRSLVLLDAAGLWLDEAPMADIFMLPPERMTELSWHDPGKAPAAAPSIAGGDAHPGAGPRDRCAHRLEPVLPQSQATRPPWTDQDTHPGAVGQQRRSHPRRAR